MHFEYVTFLKFTQNSLVLTPYLLNYSPHSFLCLSWVKIQQGEITADGDIHRVEKKYHNVSLIVASTSSVVVLKKS